MIETGKIKVLLILPSILYILLLLLFPGIFNFYASFFRWPLGGEPVFEGVKNYVDALYSDSRFHYSLQFTFLYAVTAVSIELLIGLILALILFLIPIGAKLNYAIRLLMIVPFMIAPLTAGYIWRMLFHGMYGVYTYFLTFFGYPKTDLYSDPNMVFLGVILIDVWQWSPFVFLVFYAGLSTLPKEPIEAAMIDGARGFALIRYVVLPLLKPLIIIIALLRIIDCLKVFDTIYISTGGGPGTLTESLSLYIYVKGLHAGFDLGYSGTIAWLFFLISYSITLILIIYFRRALKL